MGKLQPNVVENISLYLHNELVWHSKNKLRTHGQKKSLYLTHTPWTYKEERSPLQVVAVTTAYYPYYLTNRLTRLLRRLAIAEFLLA